MAGVNEIDSRLSVPRHEPERSEVPRGKPEWPEGGAVDNLTPLGRTPAAIFSCHIHNLRDDQNGAAKTACSQG